MIHGLREPYNNIPNWKYGELLDAFGVGYETKLYKVHTCQEWDDLLKDDFLNDAPIPQVSNSGPLLKRLLSDGW